MKLEGNSLAPFTILIPFFALYANIDGFNGSETQISIGERTEIDQWIISELHSLVKKVDEAFATYEPTKTARAMTNILLQKNLSNWYVRLCRRRFWKGEMGADKLAAYQTLFECLTTVSKLIARLLLFRRPIIQGFTWRFSKRISAFRPVP